uniref:Uncharacterized protein n=1 Tax=Wuchereria bancrofti TaxID=6293 RepID=A0AAF5PHA0_WUCBA
MLKIENTGQLEAAVVVSLCEDEQFENGDNNDDIDSIGSDCNDNISKIHVDINKRYKVLEMESRKPEYKVQEPSMRVGSGNMTLDNGENEIFQFVEYVLINKHSNAFLTGDRLEWYCTHGHG